MKLPHVALEEEIWATVQGAWYPVVMEALSLNTPGVILILIFCMFVGIIVEIVKRLVEAKNPSLRTNYWWAEFFLLLFPLILGAGMGASLYASVFPKFVSTRALGAITGTVLGAFSGFIYTLGKKGLKQRAKSLLGVKSTSGSPSSSEASSSQDSSSSS